MSIRRFTLILFLIISFILLLPLHGEEQKWKCIIYGDTRTHDAAHRSILDQISNTSYDYTFIVNVGDVVQDGNSVSDWNIWQKACNDILGGTGQDHVPPKYMACAGNHDNIDESVGLANWKKYLPGQSTQYGNNGVFFYFDYNNARFIVLESGSSHDGPQYTLMQEAVDSNPHPWLFAIWHKPIFDFGGKVYEKKLHELWGTFLYENGCDIIFTGHSHYYVRTKKLILNGEKNPPINSFMGTTHLVTGNGGAPLYTVDKNNDNNGYMVDYAFTDNSNPYYGYTELEFDGNQMILKGISADGTVMDQKEYRANPKPNITPKYLLDVSTTGEGTISHHPEYDQYYEAMPIELIAEPKLGWVFDGWTGDLTSTELCDTIIMDGNKQIIAIFSEVPVDKRELRVEIEGSGTVELDPPGFFYVEGTQVHVTAHPTDLWKLDSIIGDVQTENLSFDITLDTHKYVKVKFKALVTNQLETWVLGKGSININPSETIFIDTAHVIISAEPEASNNFLEWTGDIITTNDIDTLMMDTYKDIGAMFYSDQSTVNILYPTHDSYTRGGLYQTRNFNNMPYLIVQEDTVSNMGRYRSYMQFDLSSLEGEIEDAWIKLTVTADGLTNNLGVPVAIYELEDDTWNETSINWKATPEEGRRLDRRNAIQLEEASYAWDVTEFIQNEMNNDKVASLLIQDQTYSGRMVKFGNREGSIPPTLTVVTSPSTTNIENDDIIIPEEMHLNQNYPNPFNPTTNIKYSLPKEMLVKLNVFDLTGRKVCELVNCIQNRGIHTIQWDAKSNVGEKLASGLYFCFLETPGNRKTIKMLLLQ